MLEDEAHSVLDYLGDKAFGPAWILLGLAEIASAVTTAVENRYPTGAEGFAHHALDLIFPALTALAGVVSVYGRHRMKERELQLKEQQILLKHELDKLKLSRKTQPEADSGDETLDLGPVS